MTPDQAAELTRASLWLALQLAGPLLTICLAIGLVVSVFQAATQLTDQTLNFVPKLLALCVAGAALLPWALQRLSEFSHSLIESIPDGW
jgi:flagellar biosynthesis protein FliQ